MVKVSLRTLMIAVPVCGLITWQLGLAVGRLMESRVEASCSANLGAIGLAMHQYHDRYGHFPPAYVSDEHDRPMHSWRVILLEFLDPALFNAYDFNEPWDGPHNRRLSSRMPQVYACPNDPGTATGKHASYAVIAGPGTAFPDRGTTKLTDLIDGACNTILVAEAMSRPGHWMQPGDLPFDRMSFRINDPSAPCIAGPHRRGANVLFVDLRLQYLSATRSPLVVRTFATIAAGDIVSECPY